MNNLPDNIYLNFMGMTQDMSLTWLATSRVQMLTCNQIHRLKQKYIILILTHELNLK